HCLILDSIKNLLKTRITVNCSCDTEQGHEDTMMGSHPGGRVTACIIRCLILEYLMEMMVIFISPLGSVSLGSFPVRVPYDISPCSDELTIGYCFFGLKSLELEFATLMVGFTTVLLGRDIWDIVDTSNTSLGSCVIEVKSIQLMLRRTSTRAIQA
ncbi:hypothetical protein IGI04_007135, partial [Brassica rapa subsp. trilocularis]